MTLRANILAFNMAMSDGDIASLGRDCAAPETLGAPAVLICCNLFGNVGGDWTGCFADQADVNGNLSADPLFCDSANGDYHINYASLCAPANNGCGVLIGALEAAT